MPTIGVARRNRHTPALGATVDRRHVPTPLRGPERFVTGATVDRPHIATPPLGPARFAAGATVDRPLIPTPLQRQGGVAL